MTKKLKQQDGTIAYYTEINGINKLHNPNGPALIPQGNKKQAEYYLYGIKHTKEKWEEKKKSGDGVPWFKTSAGKASGARV